MKDMLVLGVSSLKLVSVRLEYGRIIKRNAKKIRSEKEKRIGRRRRRKKEKVRERKRKKG